MKRYLFYILAALSAAMFFSCKEVEVEPSVSTLALDRTALSFGPSESSETVILATEADQWQASLSQGADWCTVEPLSGSGDADITVYVSQNVSSRRSATVTFSAENAKTVTLTIIQNEGNVSVPAGISVSPEEPDADGPCTVYFKAGTTSPLYGYTGDVYAHIGVVDGSVWSFVPAAWDENIDKCRMEKVATNTWAIYLQPDIRTWFGSGEASVSRIGVVIRSEDGSKKGIENDFFFKVTDNKYAFMPGEPEMASVPSGAKHGINYNSDNSVTFVFYDKDRNGNRKDYSYLIGEFNGWKPSEEYAMKRDEEAGCWWYTLSVEDPSEEYLFQYYIGTIEDGAMRLPDPYTEIAYSGDDIYISSSTYPGLREYPAGTSGIVSAFCVNPQQYSWRAGDFKVDEPDDLVIYELHFRDFTATGDIAGAMEKLDYLQAVGVDAIELMPVQEFEGNDSWGYNPCSYFALDKAYGTREKYKEFIDECHSRGIAVLLDVVYNQATGAQTMAALYWDEENNKTAPENPWFNVDAPHPYSVFHDWDHESQLTRDFVKRNLEYLLTEYKVDGFRFDLTKGFTNKASTESTAANYDASRIAILKDYYSHIVRVNPDAVVILEHFCADSEERELAAAGMKVWRNLNNAYCQSAMGFSSDSSFSGLWTGSNNMPFGCYVGYMESHDEERTAYKSEAYGASGVKGNLEARMRREALNAAFFLTVPGPKMIWQFGELGYDVSLEENGRTGRKPLHWDYYDDSSRKALYDTYCNLIGFRHDNPEFFSETASFSWNVGASAWATGRSIICTAGSKSFAVVGNFDTADRTVSVELPSGGQWTNYFDRSETYSGNSVSIGLQAGEYRLLVNF